MWGMHSAYLLSPASVNMEALFTKTTEQDITSTVPHPPPYQTVVSRGTGSILMWCVEYILGGNICDIRGNTS